MSVVYKVVLRLFLSYVVRIFVCSICSAFLSFSTEKFLTRIAHGPIAWGVVTLIQKAIIVLPQLGTYVYTVTYFPLPKKLLCHLP